MNFEKEFKLTYLSLCYVDMSSELRERCDELMDVALILYEDGAEQTARIRMGIVQEYVLACSDEMAQNVQLN